MLGPWARRGHRLVVTCARDADGAGHDSRCSSTRDTGCHRGWSPRRGCSTVLDLTADGRFALLRDGTRGAECCWLLDRATGHDAHRAAVPHGRFRPSRVAATCLPGAEAAVMVYLVTDAGLRRAELVAVRIERRRHAGAASARSAARDDAELEVRRRRPEGRDVLLVWNVERTQRAWSSSRSAGGPVRALDRCPGTVVSAGCARAATASRVGLVGGEPRRAARDSARLESPAGLALAHRCTASLMRAGATWSAGAGPVARPTTASSSPAGSTGPGRARRRATRAGLPARRPGGAGAARASIRSTRLLAAAGIAVFAPNIRGSSGYGRAFVHADDRSAPVRRDRRCRRLRAGISWTPGSPTRDASR